jgi:hypothetical protein
MLGRAQRRIRDLDRTSKVPGQEVCPSELATERRADRITLEVGKLGSSRFEQCQGNVAVASADENAAEVSGCPRGTDPIANRALDLDRPTKVALRCIMAARHGGGVARALKELCLVGWIGRDRERLL